MADDWESLDFDAPAPAPAPAAPVKNEWEDEDKEEEKPQPKTGYEGMTTQQLIDKIKQLEKELKGGNDASKGGKKSKLKQALKEKEEEEERRREEAVPELSPAESLAKKIADQKRVRDADLDNAKELFGGADTGSEGGVTLIEAMEPRSKDDFDKMRKAIAAKVTKYDTSTHFSKFVEALAKDLCLGLNSSKVNEIQKSLTVLYNEKLKEEKGPNTENPKKKENKKLYGPVSSKGAKDLVAAAMEDFALDEEEYEEDEYYEEEGEGEYYEGEEFM